MFLAQFRSIDLRSREFPNTLTKMLASQEGVNAAMSLRGDDALILVDILDQVGGSVIIGPCLTSSRRLSRLRMSLASRARSSTFSGGSVVPRPSFHVPAYSRRTSQWRETSHPLPEGSQMSGKVVTMETAYA